MTGEVNVELLEAVRIKVKARNKQVMDSA